MEIGYLLAHLTIDVSRHRLGRYSCEFRARPAFGALIPAPTGGRLHAGIGQFLVMLVGNLSTIQMLLSTPFVYGFDRRFTFFGQIPYSC